MSMKELDSGGLPLARSVIDARFLGLDNRDEGRSGSTLRPSHCHVVQCRHKKKRPVPAERFK